MERDYSALISLGEVLDETGRVPYRVNRKELNSVRGTQYVASGRGRYDVWISNTQKAIRRCLMRDSLRSVYEIYSMGGVYASHIVNRVFNVITSEDIGIAEPSLPSYAIRLLQLHRAKQLTKEKLIEGVIVLTRCRKSREVDELFHRYREVEQSADLTLLESDDLADWMKIILHYHRTKDTLKEKLTDRRVKGKRRAVYKLWQAFFNHPASQADSRVEEQIEALLLKYSLRGRASEDVLTLIHAALLCYYGQRNKLKWRSLIDDQVEKEKVSWEEIGKWTDLWPLNVAYDNHTGVGRKLGRGEEFFWQHGAVVKAEGLV